MKDTVFYGLPEHAAVEFACRALRQAGCRVVSQPCHAVTHVLLPIPSAGCHQQLQALSPHLSADVRFIGGKLQGIPAERALDLLEDEAYLAQNAAITADCAMRIAGNNLPVCFRGCEILIIGWGRIGKCLARLLQSMGAAVTVSARQPAQQAALQALGYGATEPRTLPAQLGRFRAIFNTAPQKVLSRQELSLCRKDCVLIDLASTSGLEGENVILARGLPGKDLPEASGELIAQTVLRLLQLKGENP